MDFVIELSFDLIKMRILILKLYMEKLSWKIEYIYILYMCIMKKKAMLVYIYSIELVYHDGLGLLTAYRTYMQVY